MPSPGRRKHSQAIFTPRRRIASQTSTTWSGRVLNTESTMKACCTPSAVSRASSPATSSPLRKRLRRPSING